MNIDELNKFTDPSHQDFAYLFVIEGKTGASDGYMLIIDEGISGITREFPYKLQFPLKPEHDGEWSSIPVYPEPRKKECKSCSGTGKSSICEECDGEGSVVFENPYHEYDFECKSCHGIGRIKGSDLVCEDCEGLSYILEWPIICLSGGKVKSCYLEKIKKLPGAEIFLPIFYRKFLYFKYDTGYGVIMAFLS